MLDGQRLTDLRKLPNLAALYDLTSPAEVTADSVGRVSFWRDRSGNSSAMALVLNGVTGNYASTPDSAALSITGDIDIRVRVTATDWTPTAQKVLIGKYVGGAGNASFFFDVETTGMLGFRWSVDGTNLLAIKVSTVAPTVNDLAPLWVRVVLDVNNGAGGNDVLFYTSLDGTTWTQLGATVTTASVTSIFDSGSAVGIGGLSDGGTSFDGLVHYAQILNGIAGTPALTVDFAAATRGATSFVAGTGQTITINTTGATGARISGARDLYQGTLASQPIFLPWSGSNYGWLSGVAGNYFSTPDSAAVSITGDVDIRARASLDDWTPVGDNTLIAKRVGTGNQRSFYFFVANTTGLLAFAWSPDGIAQTTISSTVAPTVADGAILWARVTFDVDNGAAGSTGTFYTSMDGVTWTQLGAPVITAGVTSIFDGTAPVEVGSITLGSASLMTGKMYYGETRNGIGGAVVSVFDPSQAADGALSWVSSTGETWTVNQSGGKPALVVGRPQVLFDGSDDFLKTAPFTLNQPETVYFAGAQNAWTINRRIYDGNSALSMLLTETGTTPTVGPYAGASTLSTAGWILKSKMVITCVFNGAASFIRVNRTATVIGDVGAGNGGGFTLGDAANAAVAPSNIQVCAVAIFAAAHDNTTQLKIVDLLLRQNRIAA